MRGVAWGELYNKYRGNPYDAKMIEEEVARLMEDEEVTSAKGIYSYVLEPTKQNERYLSLRSFTDKQKRVAYEAQGGICLHCNKSFALEEMEGDHITPWSEGGKTEIDNLQMLCKLCNRLKSNK